MFIAEKRGWRQEKDGSERPEGITMAQGLDAFAKKNDEGEGGGV